MRISDWSSDVCSSDLGISRSDVMTLAQSTECAREMTSQATSTMKATVINRFNHLSHGRRCFLLSTPESIRRRPYGGPANCDTAPGITPDCRSCWRDAVNEG